LQNSGRRSLREEATSGILDVDGRIVLQCVLEKYNEKTMHNDELHSLYCSPNIIRVIKSKRRSRRDMWHAWGRGEVFRGLWLGVPKVRDH
jgi:hypothetical protein